MQTKCLTQISIRFVQFEKLKKYQQTTYVYVHVILC